MQIFTKSSEMNQFSKQAHQKGMKIGFVPTMGYLHDGHLSLAKIAKEHSDIVILSNFVNPTQFGPNEDYDKYPRDLERDNKLCLQAGLDAIFAPDRSEIYGNNESVWIYEEKLSTVLCGKSRPGHFRGVCTVVAKLFNIVQPDIAVFGMKDYQQLRIIETMVDNLKFPVKIIRAPIVRERDGLAMSSRNKYLSPEDRKNATSIYRSLQKAKSQILAGETGTHKIISQIKNEISENGGKIDYIKIVDADNLQKIENLLSKNKILIATAVFFGRTRLIDNILIENKN